MLFFTFVVHSCISGRMLHSCVFIFFFHLQQCTIYLLFTYILKMEVCSLQNSINTHECNILPLMHGCNILPLMQEWNQKYGLQGLDIKTFDFGKVKKRRFKFFISPVCNSHHQITYQMQHRLPHLFFGPPNNAQYLLKLKTSFSYSWT